MSNSGSYGTYVELCAASEIFGFIGNIFQENQQDDFSCISIDQDPASQSKTRTKYDLFLMFNGALGRGLDWKLFYIGTTARKITLLASKSDLLGCYLCPTNISKRYKGTKGLNIHIKRAYHEGSGCI